MTNWIIKMIILIIQYNFYKKVKLIKKVKQLIINNKIVNKYKMKIIINVYFV